MLIRSMKEGVVRVLWNMPGLAKLRKEGPKRSESQPIADFMVGYRESLARTSKILGRSQPIPHTQP
jgi:hypothetical protein